MKLTCEIDTSFIPKDILEKYEPVAFRRPQPGETFLTDYLGVETWDSRWLNSSYCIFRIILKPKLDLSTLQTTISVKDVYPNGIEIPEGYEFVRFGLAEDNETVLSLVDSKPFKINKPQCSIRIIVRKCQE